MTTPDRRRLVAPLLASRVFFANTVDTQEGLRNVQWVYLGVACFVACLIILFFLAVWSQFCYVGAQVAVAVRLVLPTAI